MPAELRGGFVVALLALIAGGSLWNARPASASQSPAPPTAAPAGRVRLVVERVHGDQPFALVGERLVIRGIVTPYEVGQRMSITLSRDGREVLRRSVALRALGERAAFFWLSYSSPKEGVLSAVAVHAGTAQLGPFRARSRDVRLISPDLRLGSRGPSVWVLQSVLARLRYALPVNGVFDEATGRAVIAYRKMTGLARVPWTDPRLLRLLRRGAGSFHVRFKRDGRHVEADLATQVLAEIEPGGRVRAIYTMSSGKPSTPTVLGRFQVYSKTPGINSEGMVDSNYFISGYAIHGYAEVPTYAASHGCLRVPIPDAASIYGWVRLGTVVDVYD